MARISKKLPGINMTPMIDVVFQMIIFFICTSELEKFEADKHVELYMAPHGRQVEKRDPLTVTVNVRDDGMIVVSGFALTPATFRGVMATSVARHGTRLPVVIRGDYRTAHHHVRAVMDICKEVGIWRISFAAIKHKA